MHPRDREIVKRYKAGATLDIIAGDFELSRAGVAKVLEKAGVKRRRRGPALKLPKWMR